jgi:hypothetical protein
MNLDNQQVVDSLELINKTASQTRRSIAAKYSSPHIILWGCIAIAGYLLTHFYLSWVRIIWITLGFLGWLGMFLISSYQKRRGFPTKNSQYILFWWQPIASWTAFYAFIFISLFLLKPQSGIALNAYIILVIMLAYINLGIWNGEIFMIGLGIVISAGTLIGVYWIPAGLYCFWMALTAGGMLVTTGICLHVKYR